MGRKLKVAAIQMDGTPAPVPGRLSRAADLIAEAANGGARLVVLPELFNTGYGFDEHNYALAEAIDGQTVTWMKAQAALHGIHLAGTLLLVDETDVYNAALLVAPDGRTWRHDKINVILWERAFFREGHHTTFADTDLGKLGLMICSDTLRPDLWEQYAGKVHAMVLMFSPGNTSQAHLVFPDGFRIEYPEFEKVATPADKRSDPGDDVIGQCGAWLHVPAVCAGATGVIRTRLPGLETLLQGSGLSDRASQASDVWLEMGFAMATLVADPDEGFLAQGTTMGDGVVSAEIELADAPPPPQGPQPSFPPLNRDTFNYYVAELMLPLYQEGTRRQWGPHMAYDRRPEQAKRKDE
jgi:predicted amidohydrolase